MMYARRIAGLLLLTILTFSLSPAMAQQEAMNAPRLTEDQIKRFINSYPALHAMARNYWGERKYTPTHKMLYKGPTFERAFTEMKWAGKLPDFDNLLQSYGFDGRATWMQLIKRISQAHMILRMEKVNPGGLETLRKARAEQLTSLQQKRAEAQKLPEGLRVLELESLRKMEIKLEGERLHDMDAESLRPFYSQFEAMNNSIREYKQ
jgi:hypothetical protein